MEAPASTLQKINVFSATLHKISVFGATIKVRQLCLRQERINVFSATFLPEVYLPDFDSCTEYIGYLQRCTKHIDFLQSFSRGFHSSRLYLTMVDLVLLEQSNQQTSKELNRNLLVLSSINVESNTDWEASSKQLKFSRRPASLSPDSPAFWLVWTGGLHFKLVNWDSLESSSLVIFRFQVKLFPSLQAKFHCVHKLTAPRKSWQCATGSLSPWATSAGTSRLPRGRVESIDNYVLVNFLGDLQYFFQNS